VQKEITYGEFAKRIHLPVAVEYEDAAASYADGLLIIALPIAVTAYRPTARTELHIMVKRTHS
jgi:HSP20 family molecular chaperone IbpA